MIDRLVVKRIVVVYNSIRVVYRENTVVVCTRQFVPCAICMCFIYNLTPASSHRPSDPHDSSLSLSLLSRLSDVSTITSRFLWIHWYGVRHTNCGSLHGLRLRDS